MRLAEKNYKDHLRSARAMLGWNLDVASEKSGIHRQTISRIESGESTGMLVTVEKLVKAYSQAGVAIEEDAVYDRREKSTDAA